MRHSLLYPELAIRWSNVTFLTPTRNYEKIPHFKPPALPGGLKSTFLPNEFIFIGYFRIGETIMSRCNNTVKGLKKL
jgi:hypothetical protein